MLTFSPTVAPCSVKVPYLHHLGSFRQQITDRPDCLLNCGLLCDARSKENQAQDSQAWESWEVLCAFPDTWKALLPIRAWDSDQSKSPSSCTYGPFLLRKGLSGLPLLSAVSQAAGACGASVTACRGPLDHELSSAEHLLCASQVKHRLHLRGWPLCHTHNSAHLSPSQESDVLIAPTAICNCYWLVYLFVSPTGLKAPWGPGSVPPS